MVICAEQPGRYTYLGVRLSDGAVLRTTAKTTSTGSERGFLARTAAEEARCPGMEMNQLVAITDVTQRVQDATKAATPETFNDVQKATLAAIEKDCGTTDDVRCEVVSLYQGGRYDLYKYRRYQDVRLVFAPEDRIASFGGDPDNFNFPRYDLDVSMVRIYGSDGKPLQNAEHLA